MQTLLNNFSVISVIAMFGEKHQDFVSYLFLVAPISLMFLNPIGFALLELAKWRNTNSDQKGSKMTAVLAVLQGVAFNPIVFMTVAGIVCNLVFGNNVPKFLTTAVKLVGG